MRPSTKQFQEPASIDLVVHNPAVVEPLFSKLFDRVIYKVESEIEEIQLQKQGLRENQFSTLAQEIVTAYVNSFLLAFVSKISHHQTLVDFIAKFKQPIQSVFQTDVDSVRVSSLADITLLLRFANFCSESTASDWANLLPYHVRKGLPNNVMEQVNVDLSFVLRDDLFFTPFTNLLCSYPLRPFVYLFPFESAPQTTTADSNTSATSNDSSETSL
ncbi:hypothetical protein BLNAU_9459 [Blattamonas nauphoetae]|uniref:Uncharacterized protein n=1 Tax=Blattamonas nauphoetae TaxID=2049346 RepID=A0ABQ9XVU9_9EUKA|nr:hypothetical protein BLNAU_9459 [Blattamonas nauphoetae]